MEKKINSEKKLISAALRSNVLCAQAEGCCRSVADANRIRETKRRAQMIQSLIKQGVSSDRILELLLLEDISLLENQICMNEHYLFIDDL